MLFDLHIHSHFSYDSLSKIDDILNVSKKKGLSGIAIIDHEEFQGSLEAVKKAKNYGLFVIPGMEIATEHGDIIGLFLKRKVTSKTFLEVFAEIRKQGGLIVLPHPFKRADIIPSEVLTHIDLIEVFNARGESIGQNNCNNRAYDLALTRQIPYTAGSDGHFLFEIGRGCIDLGEVSNLEQVKERLTTFETRVIIRKDSSNYVEVASQFIKAYKKRDGEICKTALQRLGRTLMGVFLVRTKNFIKSFLVIVYNTILEPLMRRDYVPEVRNNVNRFLKHCLSELPLEGPVLDIGPQPNSYSTVLFSPKFRYLTVDIDPSGQADIIADICAMPNIETGSFGTILCTEVLEHTVNPFLAVDELYRVLKPNGYCLVTTPFNLRIHGPSPDCWRFTEEGLKILFKRFNILQIRSIVPCLRRGMPIHYTAILQKK